MTAVPIHPATLEEVDRIYRRHLADTADRPLLHAATDEECLRWGTGEVAA